MIHFLLVQHQTYSLPVLLQGTFEVLRISPTPNILVIWLKLVMVSVCSAVLGDVLVEASISYHIYSAASLCSISYILYYLILTSNLWVMALLLSFLLYR